MIIEVSLLNYLNSIYTFFPSHIFGVPSLISMIGVSLTLVPLVAVLLYRLKKSKDLLRLEKQRYKTLFGLTSDVLWEYSIEEDTLTKTDPDLGILTGFAKTTNYGHIMRSTGIVFPEDLPIFEAFYQDMRNGKKDIHYVFRARTLVGTYEWFELTAATIYNSFKKPLLIVGQTTNIHQQKLVLNDLTHSMENDELTKVYNQTTLRNKINSCLSNANKEELCAFFLIDIDHLEQINSKYGYVFGDALLLEVASRIKRAYQTTDAVLGRIGGDEFVLYFPSINSKEDVETEASHILNLISSILSEIAEGTMVSACIGIDYTITSDTSFDSLLKNSMTALFYSKQQKEKHYTFYDKNTMDTNTYQNSTSPICITEYGARKSSYSLVDSKLITQVVDILSDAKEMECSIQIILGIIGSFYDLKNVSIIEESPETKNARISYEWRASISTASPTPTIVSREELEKINLHNQENLGYLVANNMDDLRPISDTLYRMTTSANITGFLGCTIHEHSILKSYITYCFDTPNRLWEQHELDTLLLLAKVIGGYLSHIQTKKQAQWLQRIDSLTECNNLTTFHKEANRILQLHPNEPYILFCSDIDKFKLINEEFGYEEGNRVLIEFANVMRSITGPNETFARADADKFVGLFRYDNPKQFLAKINTLNDAMNELPCSTKGSHRISIIIGLCPIVHEQDLSLILDQATMARKSITNRHKSRYAFFNEEIREKLINQHEIENQMELALQNEHFKVFYQPKFHLDSNTISGAEALVRWMHPEKGLIPPDSFIPIFEENHFILKLDFYVFEHVCQHIRNMMDLGKTIYPISVNFSRLHLNDTTLIAKLQEIINHYGVPPKYLEIELTESAFLNNHTNMYHILVQLRKIGFKISMDDFGSGLSSLNLLCRLPCDILKIDKDFFQQGTTTERERIVISTIVKMAQALNMVIVSEGVETEEQADFLRSIDCDLAQGYLYAKPMKQSEYEETYYEV